jgi:hypothetical protein
MTEENKDLQQAPEAPAAAPAEGQAPSADLNLNDLAAVKSIIDIATQRGTFKASEMEAVGKLYNKLSAFLDSVTKKE